MKYELSKLKGTISFDGEVIAYCVKDKEDDVEKLVERADKFPRAKEFLEEILEEDEIENERLKGRIEEFLNK